jgi:anti-sigma factor RsiW
MTITRDIVVDLLPLYAAGEASADARAAVEAFIARDASLAGLLRALQSAADTRDDAALPDALEREAVNRARRVIRRRSWLFGLAILCSLLPLSFAFEGGRIVFLMLRDQPASALLWLVAGGLWWSYARMSRELQSAGL